MKKPLAAITIDVDSLWVLADSLGFSAAPEETDIYGQAVPEFLGLLGELSLKATFFCIGNDMNFSVNRAMVAEMVRQGHDIGNHSMSHPSHWQRLGPSHKRQEILEADRALKGAGATSISGFRSSGYYLDDDIICGLMDLAYAYDTSVIPSPWPSLLMPLGRWVMARSGRGSRPYGSPQFRKSILRPHRIYPKDTDSPGQKSLMELPISCVPGFRFPFHSTFVFGTGLWLFRWGLQALCHAGLPLVYMFHAVDLLPGNANGRLRNYVTTRLPFGQRKKMVRSMLLQIKEKFHVTSCLELAIAEQAL